MDSTKTPQLVVYYWTNLVKSKKHDSLEQQRVDFSNWINNNYSDKPNVLAEFVDTHIKRTKPNRFPELVKAVNYCTRHNAKLVIVKLNGLISQNKFANLLATNGLDFVCLDKSLVTPDNLAVVRQYAAQQSKQHADSIKRGLSLTSHKLGNPNAARAILPFNKIKSENSIMFALLLQPVIAKYRKAGLSQRKMVDALNESGILAPEGGKWVLSQLQKVLKRVDANDIAMSVSDHISNNNLENYSAADLVAALNQHSFLPKNGERTEETLNTAKEREESINQVLELYDFMGKHESMVSNYVTTGKSLNNIAQELNTQSLKVPDTLYDTAEEKSTIPTWNEELVEKLIKRLDNRLHWHIEGPAVSELISALDQYCNNSFETDESVHNVHRLYSNKHDLLEKLVGDFTGHKN